MVSKLNINNCLRNVEFTNNHNILYSKQFSLSLYSLEGKFESIESTNTSTSRRNYDKLKGKSDNENHCDVNFPFPKKKYPILQISPKIWPHAFCPVGKYLPTKIYRNLGGGMHWCVLIYQLLVVITIN